jgi:hypothetical protein
VPSALLVRRSLFVLGPFSLAWTLRSSPPRRPPTISRRFHPLMGLGPLRSLLTTSRRSTVFVATPLLGFRPLQRYHRAVLHDRACLARSVPPPGFHNLLTVCSFPDPGALFHAPRAPGVLPSEPSPLQQPCRLSTASCPPVVPPARPLLLRAAASPRCRLQGFPPLQSPLPPRVG